MTDARQKAIEALEPFARMADALDGDMPRYLKKPGAVLLSYSAATLTTTHLRQARDALKLLKETK